LPKSPELPKNPNWKSNGFQQSEKTKPFTTEDTKEHGGERGLPKSPELPKNPNWKINGFNHKGHEGTRRRAGEPATLHLRE